MSTSVKPKQTPIPRVSAKWLAHPVHFFSLGFGSGLAPKAPGTFGTLAAVPLAIALHLLLAPWAYVAVAAVAGMVGIWLCRVTADALKVHDHPAIVWDEVAGYLLALSFLPLNWVTVVGAFALFRFFDIVKPGPIGWCDRRLEGGLGIMADDLLAGVASALVLHLGYFLANTLL
ncbi:phosphatidylglycerophosphatase A [Pseudidiomarina sediminum]|uniref:Phosphatidylglycerophosphatase A n=1 Tax=Pseudidiomarina sediminum TaxID=431675 RepID=A0A432Z0Z4_9GAMM|nr:phosphatidylglycerophosphatase A [Pseudidiomarina sediminum]MBY6064939.1 phosphatidylglycerophosphatase A [Pseudidiomarina sediminum]RUO69831.1 phosphatidylglycerophosphatase A [Pseudidiomarina sediminum]